MLVGGEIIDVLFFGNGDLVEWDPSTGKATRVFSEALFDPQTSGDLPNEKRPDAH